MCRACWSTQELKLERLVDIPNYADAPKAILIGEAPSLYRKEAGVTFGGRSKSIFEGLLERVNLDRSEVYCTNVVKCALYRKKIGVHESCVWWLFRELEILEADSVIIFGRSASIAVGGPKDVRLTTGEFYARDIRFLTYPHPMTAVYSPPYKDKYIAGTEELFKRLRVRPKRLGDYIG